MRETNFNYCPGGNDKTWDRNYYGTEITQEILTDKKLTNKSQRKFIMQLTKLCRKNYNQQYFRKTLNIHRNHNGVFAPSSKKVGPSYALSGHLLSEKPYTTVRHH